MADAKMEEKTIKQAVRKDYITAVGRRREAVAIVRLYKNIADSLTWGEAVIKKGEIYVNKKPIEEYFNSEVYKTVFGEPLRVTNTLGRYTFTIKVSGGGKSGQLGAVVHGLARSLVKADASKFRPVLKKRGFLTRDARTRERRKVGTGGKARREKQSPKR